MRARNQQHKVIREVLAVKTRAAAPLDHLHKHSPAGEISPALLA